MLLQSFDVEFIRMVTSTAKRLALTLIDCCESQIARIENKCSAEGHYIDQRPNAAVFCETDRSDVRPRMTFDVNRLQNPFSRRILVVLAHRTAQGPNTRKSVQHASDVLVGSCVLFKRVPRTIPNERAAILLQFYVTISTRLSDPEALSIRASCGAVSHSPISDSHRNRFFAASNLRWEKSNW
jgi:hypothetical protein